MANHIDRDGPSRQQNELSKTLELPPDYDINIHYPHHLFGALHDNNGNSDTTPARDEITSASTHYLCDSLCHDSTHYLPDGSYNDSGDFDSPLLRQVPTRSAYLDNRKRDLDEMATNSSDAPFFSSDDRPSASAENHLKKRHKRQHQSSWATMDHVSDIAECGMHPEKPTPQGPFRGAFDSGTWMGSNDIFMGIGFEVPTNSNDNSPTQDKDLPDDGESEESLDETTLAPKIKQPCYKDLFDEAMQTTKDPGGFEGPLFPYWRKQPENLETYHALQEAAHKKILACIVGNHEVLDLSSMDLSHIRKPTLQALRYFNKQGQRKPNSKRLEPKLSLNLSNNSLEEVPSELYHSKYLKVLSLRSNNLAEILPAFSNLTTLEELDISSNQLPWLPWEALELLKTRGPQRVNKYTVYPNPFIKPVPSVVKVEDLTQRAKQNPYRLKRYCAPKKIASTRIAFLDLAGSSHRNYSPAPSSTSDHWETSLHSEDSIYPPIEEQTKVPSLMETAMRACSKSSQLSQLPFLLPENCSPYIKHMLESAWTLKESGGRRCSVCNGKYIIPRTEWVEWWTWGERLYNRPLPFLRRGCSWQCFEESSLVPIRGWSSSIAPGGRAEEPTMASMIQ